MLLYSVTQESEPVKTGTAEINLVPRVCLGSIEFRLDENKMRERFIIVELNVESSLFCETGSLE